MRLAVTMFLAAISGFVSLSYEILLYRTISFGLSGAAIVFPMLLGAFLLGIALGARVSDSICSRTEGVPDVAALRFIAAFVFGSNILAFLTMGAIAWLAGAGIHFVFWLLLVTITSALLGAQFPLIADFGVEPNENAGRNVSYVYGANIIGSTSGSLLTGVVILNHVSLSATTLGLCIAGTTAGFLLYASTRPDRRNLFAALGVLLAVIAASVLVRPLLFDKFWERLLFQDEHVGRHFKTVVENKHGVITVDEEDTIYGGGIFDGGFNVMPGEDNHVLRAYTLGLFHPEPKTVLMVGLSSGSWATIVANHPDVEKLVIIEINPGYLEILPTYEERLPLLNNPKVEIVIDDGRSWLARHPDVRFDAVVANHSHHWRNLASNLLSVEYNDMVRAHMNPGAVYLYNTTASDRVFRTAFETWDHVARFQTCAVVSDRPIEPNVERWREQLRDYDIWGEPVFEGSEGDEQIDRYIDQIRNPEPVTKPEEELFDNIWEPQKMLWDRVEDARPITDDNMGTEWSDGLYQ